MKRKLTALALAVIMLLTCVACGTNSSNNSSKKNSSNSDSESTTNTEPIKLGVMSALTGDRAVFGQAEAAGVEMAVKDINAAGGIMGREVELYKADTRGTTEDGVNACRQLIDQYDVDMIIGPSTSGIVIACAPICAEAGVPMLGATCTNPKCTVNDDGSVNEYTWRFAFTDPYQGEICASYAKNELDYQTAAILYDVGSDYAVGLSEAFVSAFTEKGGEIVAQEGYNTGDVDYRSQLTKIKDLSPDVIFLPNQYQEIALAAKQMADLGFSAQIMCGDSGAHLPIIEVAGDAYNGAYYVTFFSAADPVVAEFLQRYVKEYNLSELPSSNNVIAFYDITYWAKDVIERAGGTDDDEALRDAVNETNGLELKTGTMTVDPSNHNPLNREAVLMHVEEGKQVFVGRYKPE